MLKTLNGEKDNTLISIAIGKFTAEDFKKLISSLEEKSKNHTPLRWYFEIEDIDDTNKDLNFSNAINFEKIAIVGKKENRELTSSLFKDLNSEVRFFELKDQEKAHNWIEQD